jgi:hypothetical protein
LTPPIAECGDTRLSHDDPIGFDVSMAAPRAIAPAALIWPAPCVR